MPACAEPGCNRRGTYQPRGKKRRISLWFCKEHIPEPTLLARWAEKLQEAVRCVYVRPSRQ